MPRDLIISFEAISYDLLAPGQKHELIVLFVTEMSQAAWRNLGPDVESFVLGHAEAARA
ncbi:hypothetical protein [Crenobacter luteus]|uniref:hypothetical protein n=1 Tax=Crenobacter luteus TaxID=1452487 RepID=UPI0012E91CFF|nr:hypothetical protein [Crenobacter luteus]